MSIYTARFLRNYKNNSTVAILSKGPEGEVNRVFPRPAYTMTEAAQTAEWLNERTRGYPRAQTLEHLYNGRG